MPGHAIAELMLALLCVGALSAMAIRWRRGQRFGWPQWLLLIASGLVTAVVVLASLFVGYLFVMFKVVPWLAGMAN